MYEGYFEHVILREGERERERERGRSATIEAFFQFPRRFGGEDGYLKKEENSFPRQAF